LHKSWLSSPVSCECCCAPLAGLKMESPEVLVLDALPLSDGPLQGIMPTPPLPSNLWRSQSAGMPASPPPPIDLVRARTVAAVYLSKRLASGQQRFSDNMLARLIDNDERSFTSADNHESAENQDGASLFGGLVEGPPQEAGEKPAMQVIWKCSICLEEKAISETCHKKICGRVSCDTMFCSECLHTYFRMSVEGSKFSVLPMRCPAPSCGQRVPGANWSKYVSESDLDTYETGARNLLSFRCPDCHETSSLFVEALRGNERLDALETFLQLTAEVDNDSNDRNNELRLRREWSKFAAGAGTADDVLLALSDMFAVPVEEWLDTVLELIEDVERRCILHLTCLRRNPKIYTPCCSAELCWKCKIEGHHEGVSCEEIQRQELEIPFQCCPGCDVPTQKTEGCDHMVCLCGTEWTWKD